MVGKTLLATENTEPVENNSLKSLWALPSGTVVLAARTVWLTHSISRCSLGVILDRKIAVTTMKPNF